MANAAPKNPQDTLTSYFDDSAAAVRQTFSRVEKSYVLPIVDLIRSLFMAHPISFVFLSTFAILSLFPVLAFIVVSMATLSTALTIALCFAFAFSATVFLLLGSVLFTTLGLALLLSGFFTAFVMSAYLSGRLVLALRRSGRHGFSVWSQEVTQTLSPWFVHRVSLDEDQYASEDSGFLVGKGAKDDYTTKTEPPGERSDTELKNVT
ncbi:hypothetical protein BGY98DRAFT_947529 [Russula aff. rugulosa BPL654]|nr:hypothetical protein BGY98DRAFT_947529 [Russula aff. rugulosa BPL654]